MDPINSWLDPEQVRKLAERLAGQGQASPGQPDVDAGPQARTTGTGTAGNPVTPPPAPASPAKPAAEAPLPQGRLIYQIHRFRDWLHQRHPVSGLFVLDHDGRVVFDEGDCGNIHFLARHGCAGGNFRTKVGPSAVVEIIPLDTPAGRLVMGAVVGKPLTCAEASEVTEALRNLPTPPEQTARLIR